MSYNPELICWLTTHVDRRLYHKIKSFSKIDLRPIVKNIFAKLRCSGAYTDKQTNSKTTTNAFESFSDYIASGMLQYDASKYDDGYYGSRKQLLYSNDLTTVEKIRQKIKDERTQKKKERQERFNKAFNIQDEKPTRRK